MSRDLCISIGQRHAAPRDSSCTYGVVFGDAIVEPDRFYIGVVHREKSSTDVRRRVVDLYVVESKPQLPDEQSTVQLAYADVDSWAAANLEAALRCLIAQEATLDEYEARKKLALTRRVTELETR